MYPAYSLYPHGALMICEDASEYDANLPTPEEKDELRDRLVNPPRDENRPIIHAPVATDEPPKVNVAELKVTKIAKEIGPYDVDPTLMIIRRFSNTYNNVVCKMSDTTVDESDPNLTVEKIEWLISAYNTVANVARKMLAMTSGLNRTFDDVVSYEYAHHHLGFVIRHADQIKASAPSTFPYTTMVHPAFASSWRIRELVYNYAGNPTLLEHMNSLSAMTKSTDEKGVLAPFDDLTDMMEAVYNDPAKYVNSMEAQQRSLSMEGTFYAYSRDLAAPRDQSDIIERDYRDTMETMLNLISCTLRKCCIECYDLICSLTEDDEDKHITAELCKRVMKKNTVIMCNLFGLATAVAMCYATSIKLKLSTATAVRNYVDKIVAAVKNGNKRLDGSEPAKTVEITIEKTEPEPETPAEAQPAS